MERIYVEFVKPIECARVNAINYQIEFAVGEVKSVEDIIIKNVSMIKLFRPMLSVVAFFNKEGLIPATDPKYNELPDIIPQALQLPPLAYLQATTKSTRFDDKVGRYVSDFEKDYDFNVYIPYSNVSIIMPVKAVDAALNKLYTDFVNEHYSNIEIAKPAENITTTIINPNDKNTVQ